MNSSSDRLIGILENTCVFSPDDIASLNQLLAETRAEDIPRQLQSEVIDIIDMMHICGNVSPASRVWIDNLYDRLSCR